VRAIAKQLGLSRVTVTRAVQAAGPPQYRRAPSPSAFDVFEADVRRLLKATPSMPATVVAERVGWTGSSSWFRKKVAQLRPEFAPKDPADRITYRAGDQAQCDLWFPPADIPLGGGRSGSPPVLVIVESYSRFITAVMLPSRTTPDLLAGMWLLLSEQLHAVPHRLIWDNEAGIGRRNKLADGVTAFCGALATKIVQLKPYDPESKGIVERANQFLETSFLPGRTFTSVTDFNEQLRRSTDYISKSIDSHERTKNFRYRATVFESFSDAQGPAQQSSQAMRFARPRPNTVDQLSQPRLREGRETRQGPHRFSDFPTLTVLRPRCQGIPTGFPVVACGD